MKPILLRCCAALCFAGSLPVLAQAPAQPPRNERPHSLMHQLEAEVTDIVTQSQPAVVSIEGRITRLNLVFPDALRQQLMQEFGKLPAENRAQVERNFLMMQEAMKSTEKDKMFALGPPQAGSGFLIAGGFAVTTAEVVSNMTDISVVLSNGARIRPVWINADPFSNIAVLKLNLPNAPALEWGNSAQVRAGNLAVVIGNQAGFANSAGLGLIAGINRSGRSGNLRYRGLIQFQGAVGAGNSGSPLLNSDGDVIGMVVAAPAEENALPFPNNGVPVPPGQNEGNDAPPQNGAAFLFFNGIANTGFALPANHLRSIIDTLSQGANVKPIREGWLGLRAVEKVTASGAEGLLVDRVYADSPAADAGILPGDRLLRINGQPIATLAQMKQLTQNVKAGVVFQLQMQRGSIKHSRTLTTHPRPDPDSVNQMPMLLRPTPPKN